MSDLKLYQKAQLVRVRLLTTNCKIIDLNHKFGSMQAEVNHNVFFLRTEGKADSFAVVAETKINATDPEDSHEVLSFECKIAADYKIIDRKTDMAEFEKKVDLFSNQIYLTTRSHMVGIMTEMGLNGTFMPYSLSADFLKASKKAKEIKKE